MVQTYSAIPLTRFHRNYAAVVYSTATRTISEAGTYLWRPVLCRIWKNLFSSIALQAKSFCLEEQRQAQVMASRNPATLYLHSTALPRNNAAISAFPKLTPVCVEILLRDNAIAFNTNNGATTISSTKKLSLQKLKSSWWV